MNFLCFSAGREAEGEHVDGACELCSDLSISLLGQPLTTQDIIAAEIQPYFSAYTSLCSVGLLNTEAYARPMWNSS